MKLRVIVAAGAVLLLTGCGSVHPGAAAVVGDTTIPMGQADDVAGVYCRLALLSARSGEPIGNADVRRQAITDLVFGVVARDVATEKDIRPNPSSYEVTPVQRAEIAKAVPADQLEAVVAAIVDSQRTFAIAEIIGSEELGADVDPSELQNEGLKQIQAEIGRREVRFDPRFGIGNDGLQKAVSGSLSVPEKAPSPEDQKGLPATQQCVG